MEWNAKFFHKKPLFDMSKNLLVFSVILFLWNFGIAQDPCTNPIDPGTNCANAPIICASDLQGFCSTTPPTANGIAPPGFCASSVDNNQWIAFVAGGSTFELTIYVTNCQGSNQPPGGGIQAQIFGANGVCDGFFPVSNCYNAGVSNGTAVLTANNVICGQIYYLIVDGWAFDQCDWEVDVTGGSVDPPPLQDPGPIVGETDLCPNPCNVYTYQINPNNNCVGNYVWEVNGGTILTPAQGPNATAITVSWPNAVNGEVCVTAQAPCNDTLQTCIPVTVTPVPDVFEDTTVCENTFITWCGQFITAPGIYTCTETTPECCEYQREITVNWNPSTFGVVEETLCTDEEISFVGPGGITYTFQGDNLPTSSVDLVFPGGNSNGCDSFLSVILTPDTTTINAAVTNVTCSGGSDGSIDLNIAGATPPVDIDWNDNSLDGIENATNLTPGFYAVTVTSSEGCVDTFSVNLTANIPMNLMVDDQQNISCNSASDGSISLSVDGGSPGFTYSWSPAIPGNPEDPTGLAGGTYDVTVTDANGCTDVQTITLTEPSAVNINVDTIINVDCNSAGNGSIALSITGGQPGYSYNWNPAVPGNPQDPNGLDGGTYAVTVTDANGCTADTVLNLTEPSALTVTIDNVTDVDCNSAGNGSIELTVNGGAGNYSFNWSPAIMGNPEDPTGLDGGVYSVTVTDDNGCTAVTSAQVDEPSAIDIDVDDVTDVSCNSGNDGSISISVTGGTPTYSFSWSPAVPGNPEDPTGLTAGTYVLTVQDANGCTAEEIIVVDEPNVLEITVDDVTQVNCNGGNNGSISLSVSGGTPAYSYNWDPAIPGNPQDPTGLTANTYSVTVTDANGCTDVETISINEPNALDASIDSTDVSCNAGTDGAIDITLSGGTPPYNFNWNDAGIGNEEDPTGLDAGNYSVTITDQNNCEVILITTINQPTALNMNSSVTNVNCNGGDDGAIDITVSGGTPPYNYSWDNGLGAIEDPTGITSGTYTVMVTDANGCMLSQTFPITEPTALVLNSSVTDVSCNGGNDGAIDIDISGGTPGYTFNWDPPLLGNPEDPANLAVGTYDLTITDANGCTISTTATLTEPTALTITGTGSDADCDVNNGSIDITVGGGVAPYSYDWNPATTPDVEDPTGLGPGTYTVTVTDDNGCTIDFSVPVSTPTGLGATAVASDASCFGADDGSIDLTINGGTAPYTIDWDDPGIPQDTEDPTGLLAGPYGVTVTDIDGCSVVASATVDEPTELTVSGSSTNAICGEANGAILIDIQGGTQPYVIDWDDDTIDGEANPINLDTGTYNVVITDLNGCVATTAVTVNTPGLMTVDAVITNLLCNSDGTGAIDVTVTGGNPGYTYEWNNFNFNGLEDIDSLMAGNYSLTVTDIDGCTVVLNEVVAEPPVLDIAATATDVNCNSAADGTMDVTVTGGTAPYAYDWNDDTWDGTEDPDALGPGTWSVTVSDDNGCTTEISETITEPAVLAVSGTTVNAVCGEPNGVIDLTVTGGTVPYTIIWSDTTYNNQQDLVGLLPGLYFVTITDANNCEVIDSFDVSTPNALVASFDAVDILCNGESTGSIDVTTSGGTPPYNFEWDSGETTEDLSDLPAGDYSLTITDGDDCEFIIDVLLTEPPVLEATSTGTPVTCFESIDGTIDVTPTGGQPPYQYFWSDPTLNGMEDPISLSPNDYEVTVTDDNGCTAVTAFTVGEPAELIISEDIANVLCNSFETGSIDVTVTGGVGLYSYDWSVDSLDGQDDLFNLAAGNYSLIVTDGNNCTAQGSFTITEPLAIFISSTTVDSVLCNATSTGAIDINILGGAPPYTVDWGGGLTGEDIDDLPAGSYQPTITDANGCVLVPGLIDVEEPQELTLSSSSVNAVCGEPNGSIELTVAGGSTPYTFDWSDDNLDGQEDPQNLAAGDYGVTVTDANGCVVNTNVSVNTPPALAVLSLTPTPASCFGLDDGAVTVEVGGGSTPYTFEWNNTDTTQNITDLLAGNYELTVTDADGCTVVANGTVTQPNAIDLQTTSAQATCGDPNGSINLTVMGGTTPYSFDWDNGDTVEDPQNLLAGDYSVTVTDANGCTAAIAENVPTPDALTATATTFDALCFGSSDGSIEVQVEGGTAPFDFDWSDDGIDGAQNPAGLSAGTYDLTITDANGCQFFLSEEIDQPAELFISGTTNDVSCNSGADGTIDVTVTGGTGPYDYEWSNGAGTNEDLVNLSANNYVVTVTDASGCIILGSFDISEPSAIVLSADFDAPSCNSGNDGSIGLNVSGGTPTYTYEWNNGLPPVEDPDAVAAGNYSVTVTDANGCTENISLSVTQPDVVALQLTPSEFGAFNVACHDSQDGSIEAAATGGTAPYSFSWSTGQSGESIQNLPAGLYTATVTDNQGCTTMADVSLAAPLPVDGKVTSFPATCFGDNDGRIEVDTALGGIPPYEYSLDGNNFATFPQFNFLEAGSYTLTVRDREGCIFETEVQVNQPEELIVDLGPDTTIRLGDEIDILAQVNDPLNLAIIEWEGLFPEACEVPDCLEQTIKPLETTRYSIFVEDNSGCQDEDEIVVNIDKRRLVSIPNAFSPNGDGENDVLFIGADENTVVQIDKFMIFNRWGETVFELQNFQPNDPGIGWNGTFMGEELDPAVFVYFAEVTFIDGEIILYKGDVTLVK